MVSPNCVLDQAFCLFICHADYDHTGNAIYGDNADDNDDADDNDEADADDDENAPEECFQELVQ